MAVAQAERGLLARIGFFLCREGRVDEAEGVFSGLAASAPEKDGPIIGLALCRMIRGETDEAVAMLDARLGGGGELRDALTLYKLVAFGMAGRMDEARALRDDMERGGMAEAAKTADRLLEDFAAQRDAS